MARLLLNSVQTPRIERMRIVVVAPNVEWPIAFQSEAVNLREALRPNLAAIHHIGSTAIHGIVAKPTIDILLVTHSLLILDESAPALGGLGYEAMGEFGIPGRRYFRRNSAEGHRTHQIHAFQIGNPHIERYLAFRDYMNEHPGDAQSYGELKQRLATVYADDGHAYMNGKTGFINEHEAKALAWMRRRSKSMPI
jgi:GrpB-like predicted nucleotidyltransferase (UPF0157 family)